MSHLHVYPPDLPVPPVADLPLQNAQRWLSSDEEQGFLPNFPLIVAQEAYVRLVEHAASDLELEVGGALVGILSIDRQSRSQFILVESALPARFTRQGSHHLTFTQDSLVELHNGMDEAFPGKQIVGWYHTHPGLGVFLSPHDTWLHNHFFPEPWQVALVIDPLAETGGFFIRLPDGVLDPLRSFGFYELEGKSHPGIVRWKNLQPEPDDTRRTGVELNE
jgi:proteasome lid subunit RPN8/RPN11